MQSYKLQYEEDDDEEQEEEEDNPGGDESDTDDFLQSDGQQQRRKQRRQSGAGQRRAAAAAAVEHDGNKFYETTEALYSVKWYKDNEEFYRYLPKSNPPQHSYRVEGIRVDVSIRF